MRERDRAYLVRYSGLPVRSLSHPSRTSKKTLLLERRCVKIAASLQIKLAFNQFVARARSDVDCDACERVCQEEEKEKWGGATTSMIKTSMKICETNFSQQISVLWYLICPTELLKLPL